MAINYFQLHIDKLLALKISFAYLMWLRYLIFDLMVHFKILVEFFFTKKS